MIEVYRKEEIPEDLQLNIYRQTNNGNGFLNLKYVLVPHSEDDISTVIKIANKLCKVECTTIPNRDRGIGSFIVLVY